MIMAKGQIWRTRDGRQATITHHEYSALYPYSGHIRNPDGVYTFATWTGQGKLVYGRLTDSPFDLVEFIREAS